MVTFPDAQEHRLKSMRSIMDTISGLFMQIPPYFNLPNEYSIGIA